LVKKLTNEKIQNNLIKKFELKEKQNCKQLLKDLFLLK